MDQSSKQISLGLTGREMDIDNGAMSLNWKPTDFQNVVQVIASPGAITPYLVQAVKMFGSLSCPSPSWDANGIYRVGLDPSGALQVQKLDVDGKTWGVAKLAP
jgi:hypothetical protein